MKFRSLTAFVGAAALAAVAFGPAVNTNPGSSGARDGLSAAFAAGEVDLGQQASLALGDINDAGVPFGTTVPCTAGFAGPFPCENVDFASYIPLAELGGGAGSDSWGWHDDNDTPEDASDDRYIALMGTTLGLTYTDITNPNIPVVLGRTTITPGGGVLWRDVKVYNDHAFFVSEEGGTGIVVVDLNDLPSATTVNASGNGVGPSFAREFPPVTTYTGFGNAHNVWINTDTGRAYGVGTNKSSAGLHIVDISDPANPEFLGEFAADGYTHDVQCVIYTGPDTDYNGEYDGPDMDGDDTNGNQAELCFAANENSMTIVDVSDPTATKQIAKIKYLSSKYTHQSVVSEDMQWLLWNDEVDEGATGPGTRTYWTDITDLDLAVWQDGIAVPGINDNVCIYLHDLLTVDHNMYITGDILWQANYNGGLQIFRISDEGLADCTMDRIGYFDVDPGLDIGQYGGAWNVFPFFGQDKVIVSTLDEGLYVLQTDFEVGES